MRPLLPGRDKVAARGKDERTARTWQIAALTIRAVSLAFLSPIVIVHQSATLIKSLNIQRAFKRIVRTSPSPNHNNNDNKTTRVVKGAEMMVNSKNSRR